LNNKDVLRLKTRESLISVLPILLVVLLLTMTVAPVPTDMMLSFLIGSVFVVIGMGLFSLGADMSMTPIGSKVGGAMTKTRSLPVILIISFALGFAVTVAEPDLMVLADTVPTIDTTALLLTVGAGVGFFLAVCILRILTGVKLRTLLIVFYAIIFALSFFSNPDFLGVAFDSGGVTTGPMTVPFILAMGVGVANIRNDDNAEADSFGLVALCSIGPILAVLILGFIYNQDGSDYIYNADSYANTSEVGRAYISAIPEQLYHMALSLAPIVIIFFLFQFIRLHMSGADLLKIIFGLLYTYVGLVLFLTGVNVGFSSLGYYIGALLAGKQALLLVPLAMLFGWFIISAEPAVGVLEKQIEEVSAGAIPGKAIKLSLSIAISLAMGLSMLRVIYEIPIMYFLVPGYIIAIALSFMVPEIYTAIAFDSGGVASGPMTATFMLMFVIGAASALGRDVVSDAFGVVSMVAMMPLISIQLVGLIFTHKAKTADTTVDYGDFDIIELWED